MQTDTAIRAPAQDSSTAPDYLADGRFFVQAELTALNSLLSNLDNSFSKVCDALLHCKGRIIVTGMGKSGHIANKIAATLASTGSPALFVHPGEACHGDLGMITTHDIVVAISNSGHTNEILTMLPVIKRLGATLIAITNKPNSALSAAADITLLLHAEEEACPLGLAPTCSTTNTLVLGDAIAMTLLKHKGFTKEEFALSHPGGSLGRQLLLRVKDLMRQGKDIPRVKHTAKLTEALLEMSGKGLGMTAIVNDEDALIGIFTDGDLRRTLDRNFNVHTTLITEVMTKMPKTIAANQLAAQAIHLMETNKITALLVLDDSQRVIGAFNIHDLFKAGVM